MLKPSALQNLLFLLAASDLSGTRKRPGATKSCATEWRHIRKGGKVVLVYISQFSVWQTSYYGWHSFAERFRNEASLIH